MSDDDGRVTALHEMDNERAFQANFTEQCSVCGESPTVTATGLCGPCTFGEAKTAGGNW